MTRSLLYLLAAAALFALFVPLSYGGWAGYIAYLAALLVYGVANGYWQMKLAARKFEGWLPRLLFHFAVGILTIFGFGGVREAVVYLWDGELAVMALRFAGGLALGTMMASRVLEMYCMYHLLKDRGGKGKGGGRKWWLRRTNWRPGWMKPAAPPTPA